MPVKPFFPVPVEKKPDKYPIWKNRGF